MRRGGGHLAVAAPSFSGLVWGGADNEWCGQCSAQPAEKVGLSHLFRKWSTGLRVVSGSLIWQESVRPSLFSLGILQKHGLTYASVLAEYVAVLHGISMPVIFSWKGLLFQRFLNIERAGVPQVECSLSRDESALGYRLNLKRNKKGLIFCLVRLGKRFLLDSLS